MTINRRVFMLGAAAAPLICAETASASPVPMPQKWDETFDIVIIGAGGAGLAAADVAVDLGLKTIIIEKQPMIGGSSAICGGKWAVCGTDEQEKRGIQDSPEIFLDDMLKTGKHRNDPELVKAYIRESKVHYDFVTKVLNVHPIEVVAAAGMSVPRAHNFPPSQVLMALHDYAVKKNADLRLNTKAERLIWDPAARKIAGVLVTSENGKKHCIRARKGVLLAAGGFARNKDMLSKYVPLMVRARVNAGMGNIGDGIRMAQEFGADIADMPWIKATYGYRADGTRGNLQAYYGGAIIVNKAGKRFVDESLSYKLIGDAALAQDEGKSWQLLDEPLRQTRMKVRKSDWKELSVFDRGEETKHCFRGDTLEEVARKAGVDPKGLVETVRRYNENVEKSGTDPEFGRTSLTSGYGKLIKLEKGPFYLFPTTAVLIATYCGVRITPKAEVLDVFGEKIPNLYVAGEMTAGIHGAAYMTGSAWGKAMSFGRIAARSIAER